MGKESFKKRKRQINGRPYIKTPKTITDKVVSLLSLLSPIANFSSYIGGYFIDKDIIFGKKVRYSNKVSFLNTKDPYVLDAEAGVKKR